MRSLLVGALGLILFALGLVVNSRSAVWTEETVNYYAAGTAPATLTSRFVYHYEYAGHPLLGLGIVLAGIGAFGWVRSPTRGV